MNGLARSNPMRSPHLMTYSHDGYGLGHLRRTSNIAAHFIETAPESSVLMITGCASGPPFLLPAGIDFIKIPSLVKVKAGAYTSPTLRIDRPTVQAVRSAMIQCAVREFQPDIFLVDHLAAGIDGELLPTLRMLKARDDRPSIVLGLRDILGEPAAIIAAWRREKVYATLRQYYDEVLIYGCREIFDAALRYGISAEFPGKIRYCGYVRSEKPLRSPEQVRADLRLQKDQLVVVTGGGGRDAYPLLHSCLDAFGAWGGTLPFAAVLIAGPLMPPAQRDHLRRRARTMGVDLLTYVEDTPSLIQAADLIVTMAGYNSLCEILALGKRALVVPRPGPSAEQRMRTRIFQERGWIEALAPGAASAQALARTISALLERTDRPRITPALDTAGGARVAAELAARVRPRTTLPSALPVGAAASAGAREAALIFPWGRLPPHPRWAPHRSVALWRRGRGSRNILAARPA